MKVKARYCGASVLIPVASRLRQECRPG
ncbi:hypothetical protein AM418_005338, partial [Klebsiella pneumoniae]